MQAVKGYVENGLFFPMGKVEQTSGRIKAVLTVLDEPFEDMTQDELETIRQRRLSLKGSMKGKIRMSDDFDEPLEEMKEYME